MSSSLRRYAAMSDEVEHLDSELTELLKEIRAAVEVCEHAAHGSFRLKQSRAAGAWGRGQEACAEPWLHAARSCVHL